MRAGGEGRFPEASRAAPAPDLGLGGGAPPPPHTVPQPCVPGPCGPASPASVHVLSRLWLSWLCAAPSAPAVCRGAGGAAEGMAALLLEKGFSRSEQLPMSILFVWLVLVCGAVWGGPARSLSDAVGGRGRRGVTHPARRQHPLRLWLRSNPGEERVASCRLHCPEIQMWALAWVPSFYVRKRKISSCLTKGGKMWDLYPKS